MLDTNGLSAAEPRVVMEIEAARDVLAVFLGQRNLVSIAHHVPGRIRLKLNIVGLMSWPAIDPAPLLDLVRHMRGVRATRINTSALSVVVEYDPVEIAPATWERLLVGDAAEIEHILLDQLA